MRRVLDVGASVSLAQEGGEGHRGEDLGCLERAVCESGWALEEGGRTMGSWELRFCLGEWVGQQSYVPIPQVVKGELLLCEWGGKGLEAWTGEG